MQRRYICSSLKFLSCMEWKKQHFYAARMWSFLWWRRRYSFLVKSFSHSCIEQANFLFPSCTDSFYNDMLYFKKYKDGCQNVQTFWQFYRTYLVPLKSSFMLCAEAAISTIDSLLGMNRIRGVSFTGRGLKTKTHLVNLNVVLVQCFLVRELFTNVAPQTH